MNAVPGNPLNAIMSLLSEIAKCQDAGATSAAAVSWWGLSRAAHYTKIRRLSDELQHHSKATVRASAGRMVRDMDNWLARDQRQVYAQNVGRW